MFQFWNKKESVIFSFLQDVEAVVNLRYITSGSLKTSRRDFNPESGQVRLSLQVADKQWQPSMGFNKWDSTTFTFTEVSSILRHVYTEQNQKQKSEPA